MKFSSRQIGLGSRLFITVSVLIVIALVLQGGIFRYMVQKEIKKNTSERLSREAAAKAGELSDIVQQIREDLAIIQAHKAFEDYFTSLVFEDTDGMTAAVSTLEPFFAGISAAKPQYTKMMLATAKGAGVLELINGKRIEAFDGFDTADAVRRFKALSSPAGQIIHYAVYSEKDGWGILSAAALVFENKVEGVLWLYYPAAARLEALLTDLTDSGISCVIADGKGNTIVHTRILSAGAVSDFTNGRAEGWILSAKTIDQLGWSITLGLPKAKANAVLNKITLIGAAVLVLSLIAVTLFIGLVVRSITRPVKGIINGLKEGAEQVASASGQISSSSQSLAEGSSEQAASIEETSAALEEMSSMTKQSAAHANQADTLMIEANQVVDQANQSMTELTASMGEISTASEETSKIIKTIDEIAFQTNLLALNAAVEAARAGEAGAGFAVVADEVRNLALRAAEAAQNTSVLIEGTVKKINAGANLVSRTNEAFSRVAEKASKVGDLVAEISAASNEQAQGIEQVNTAVAEMDKVTQQNAADAEESASAAEEMSAQAEEMKAIVHKLKVVVGGSRDGARRGSSPAIEASQAETHGSVPPAAQKAQNIAGSRSNKAKITEQIVPLEDEFKDF